MYPLTTHNTTFLIIRPHFLEKCTLLQSKSTEVFSNEELSYSTYVRRFGGRANTELHK